MKISTPLYKAGINPSKLQMLRGNRTRDSPIGLDSNSGVDHNACEVENFRVCADGSCISQVDLCREYHYLLFFWFWVIFSSPDLKAQVSFSYGLLSVCLSVHLPVNFPLFHLLQNHWANFNQTWHKASFGGGNSSLFK